MGGTGTALRRHSGRNALPFVAIAAAALVALALQVNGIAGSFLSDDFAHLNVIFRFADQSALWSWTTARFYEPLGNGTFAYRPLAFATYVVDWLLYREDATGWRVTSLVLYTINAIAAGALVSRWLSRRSSRAALAGALGGCALLAYPFAGEVSYWLVGRFDLLACLFTLLYLLALPLDARSTVRQHLLRAAWLLCALLSKESAIPLPMIATFLVFACAAAGSRGAAHLPHAVRTTAAEMWPTWLVLSGYALWRIHLFGSPWKVYPTSSPPHDFSEWWERASGIATIAKENVGALYPAWTLGAVVLVLALLVTCIRARRDIPRQSVALMLAMLAGLALYLLAPGLSFPVSSPGGEGARHFYMAWVYASLLLGILVAWQRSSWIPGLALVALMLTAQAQSLAQWQAAGRQMKDIVAGVATLAATIGDDQYALLLLPDHIGVALFARTAQGSIVTPPIQRHDYLPRMAVMVGTDFPLWSHYITHGRIAELKGVPAFDPARFVGLYCWNATKGAFVPLTDGRAAPDPALWLAAAKRNFPESGCIAPF